MTSAIFIFDFELLLRLLLRRRLRSPTKLLRLLLQRRLRSPIKLLRPPTNHGPIPVVDDIERYRISISVLVENPIQLSMNEIRKLPKYTVTATLQCAGNRRTAMSKTRTVKGVGWDIAALGNENNAGNAAAIMAGLAPKTKVLRDGQWGEQDAAILVPGEIISIKLGDIIPADARFFEGDPLKIDQSALTGESLPVTKNPGDEVFSGSTCKQGEIEAVVIATGIHAFFGKAAYLVDSTNQVGHFQKVLTAFGNFCISSIAVGMFVEITVMYAIQKKKYRQGIENLLVLLIGGIPIAMPTVLSVTMAIGSHRLSQQGAISKRMTAIEEMAGLDVLCSDKTGTLTLNKLSIDKNLIEVFARGVEKDHVMLLAARASRTENQDAINAAMVGMLSGPREARAGIKEVHFLPFNPVDKRTALTYIKADGNWHCVSKGAPEQE